VTSFRPCFPGDPDPPSGRAAFVGAVLVHAGQRATDVDHLGDHRPKVLAAKCKWHHLLKSEAESGWAAAARRNPRNRPPDPYPDLRQ
jgi:hypothetical protein